MKCLISYKVDKEKYYTELERLDIVMKTTEYIYKSDKLIHVEISKNAGMRINNLTGGAQGKVPMLDNNQYFHMKTYNKKHKLIGKGSFEDKLRSFVAGDVLISVETLINHAYVDSHGNNDEVQIVVNDNNGDMGAYIEFESVEQHIGVGLPVWLSKLT